MTQKISYSGNKVPISEFLSTYQLVVSWFNSQENSSYGLERKQRKYLKTKVLTQWVRPKWHGDQYAVSSICQNWLSVHIYLSTADLCSFPATSHLAAPWTRDCIWTFSIQYSPSLPFLNLSHAFLLCILGSNIKA